MDDRNERQIQRVVAKALPLSAVEFMTLLVLDDGESHGYAIVKEIARRTNDQMKLLPGNFYAILRRLQEGDLIERTQRQSVAINADSRRRFYRITALGRRVAAADAARMKRMVEAAEARELLEDVTS